MTPEGKVKNRVKALLKQYEPRLWQHWPVQAGYGKPCLDCHGTFDGFSFAIETKAPGKKPTPRQQATIDDLLEAGCPVFVIGEKETHDEFKYSGMERLADWLRVRHVC